MISFSISHNITILKIKQIKINRGAVAGSALPLVGGTGGKNELQKSKGKSLRLE
jgi:hypothetical protein